MKIDKCRVLIADDQETLRVLIRSIVKSLGMTIVAECRNGLEAIKAFRDFQPNLILLDVNMPMRSGVDALKAIIKLDQDANVIMLTSEAEIETVKACLATGALNYILKTNSVEKIKAAILQTVHEI